MHNLLRSKLKTVWVRTISKTFTVLGSAAEQINRIIRFLIILQEAMAPRTFDNLAANSDDRLSCFPPDLHIPCS